MIAHFDSTCVNPILLLHIQLAPGKTHGNMVDVQQKMRGKEYERDDVASTDQEIGRLLSGNSHNHPNHTDEP